MRDGPLKAGSTPGEFPRPQSTTILAREGSVAAAPELPPSPSGLSEQITKSRGAHCLHAVTLLPTHTWTWCEPSSKCVEAKPTRRTARRPSCCSNGVVGKQKPLWRGGQPQDMGIPLSALVNCRRWILPEGRDARGEAVCRGAGSAAASARQHETYHLASSTPWIDSN